jgi:integrase/recombinase XerD
MTLIDEFTAHQRILGFSERTIARRRWSLSLFVAHLDGRALGDATVADLRMFLARWPSAQSRYSICSDVHQLYRFARISDPCEELPRIRVPRRGATPVHRDDVRRLLAVTVRADDRLMVLLASQCGLRISEIARVRGEDVDLGRRTLRVSGKGGRDDVLPLSRALVAELEQWPRRGFLFPGRTGQSVGARLRRLMRRHGIVGRPHDLRHAYATELVECSNGNIVLVSRLMRHADVSTTMRYVRVERDGFDLVDRLYAS